MISSYSADDESGSDSENIVSSDLSREGEELTWIEWFCELRGNEFFCEVDEDFAQDDFNLT